MKKTPMLDCEQVLARLWEFIDDELSDQTEEAVRAHLEQCARCCPQYTSSEPIPSCYIALRCA